MKNINLCLFATCHYCKRSLTLLLSGLFLLICSGWLQAHSVQVTYCVTDAGSIRVWMEHWHGNITTFGDAEVQIIVDDGTTVTNNFYAAQGAIINTTVNNLPGCKDDMVILSTCAGGRPANAYNDWAYWDFTPPECGAPLNITVNGVSGSQSWYFDEGCGNLFPTSFTANFEDCAPPQMTCVAGNTNIEVNTTDCSANVTSGLEPSILFDDCTATEDIVLTYTVTGATTASGNGNAHITYNKGVSTVMYTATDETGNTSTCEYTVTVVDTNGPDMVCPSDLSLECQAEGNATLIDDWLQMISATDECGVTSITNDYDVNGFSYQNGDFNPSVKNSPYAAFGSLALSSLNGNTLAKNILNPSETYSFKIQEMSGRDKYDHPIKVKLDLGSYHDIGKIYFSDLENRLLPHWIESVNNNSAQIWIKVPEIKANEKTDFKINITETDIQSWSRGEVVGAYDADNDVLPVVIGRGISNLDNLKSGKTSNSSAMPCNCNATQGSQTFPINAIQNAQDDVAFFSYNVPNGASANTGLEVNDAVVLFLYENTNTGEISLFILIDDAGGGNGGRGSIDFFCLPTSATLDFSDDPGEITGLFPTVTANWGWADCCTDGALIGNLGCNTTFDFFPNFTSGINNMFWVSGTLASPTYTAFGSFNDPVRIQCGMGQPSCCPNANAITSTDASCPNVADGSIDVQPDPAGAPFTYQWSNGATTEDLTNVLYGTYQVTITDKDNCEQILDVEVGLTETPVLVNCPSDITLDYSGNMITINESDLGFSIDYDCTDAVTTSCNGCGTYNCNVQNTTIPVTITATNTANESDMCTVNVFLRNTDPVISCPDDLVFECGQPILESIVNDWLTTASVSDTDGSGSIANDYVAGDFSFIDEILDRDSRIAYQSPSKYAVAEGPQDYYFNLNALSANMVNAPVRSQTVTFTATDACGNTSTCTADIIIVDTTDPEITCPSDITVECGDPNFDAIVTNWLDNATANDLCDEGVEVTNNYTNSFTGGCGSTGTRTVTFTANDHCGNMATCQATITVVDTEDPVFLMKPQDITVECDGAGNTAALNAWLTSNAGAMAEDDCDASLTWSNTNSATDLCDNTSSTAYTFTVADDCGNSIMATANFIIEDTVPPSITAPADQTISCTNTAQITAILATVSATDVCSTPTTDTQLLGSNPLCGNTVSMTYQITSTDDCGNVATEFFTITTSDNLNPTSTNPPAALQLTCGDPDNPILVAEWFDLYESSFGDQCDNTENLTITNNWDGNLPDGCNQTQNIQWTVTDGCGNAENFNSSISVTDNADPVFLNCPADFTVNVDVDNCSSNVVFSTPVGYDDCTDADDLTVTQTGGPSSGSEFPLGTSSIVFVVTDACGNTSSCDFDITVVDSNTPSINCPSNVEVCAVTGGCTWTSDNSVNAMSLDNCPSTTVEYSISGATTVARTTGNAVGTAFDLGTSTVCYFITDAASNESTCCFDVIVSDCEAPIITCPAGIFNATCGTGIPASFVATATDNCPGTLNITTVINNTISGCGNTNTQTVQFTATDAAGNTSVCYSQYATIDTDNPTISTPASNMVSNCEDAQGDFQDWLANQGGAAASDDCGGVTWSYDVTNVDNSSCSGVSTIDVTFIVTDLCGNSATTAAVFSGTDSTNPTISCPDDITLNCGNANNDAIVANWLNSASAADECGTVTISNNYTALNTAGCSTTGSTTVIFTATDGCGNTATCQASITIEDQEIPAFLMKPQNLELECDGTGNTTEINTWLTANANGMASDNCDTDVTWSNTSGATTTLCGSTSTTIYTFTITDDCGNTATANASVTISDSTAPTINPPASSTTVECDGSGNTTALNAWLIANGNITASDNCDASLDITSRLTNTIPDCGGARELVYLFTATDDCGNQAQTTSSFIIEDNALPTITCPADLDLECGDPSNPTSIQAWLESATVADACGDVELTTDFNGSLPTSCNGTVLVTFTVTDACGSTATCQASINLDDTASPDFINCGSDVTVNADVSNCGNNIIFSTPVAIDNCTNPVTITQTAGPQSGTSIPVGTHTITFEAEDACTNTETCTFQLTVVDSAVPSISCPDGPLEECADDVSCMWTSTNIAPITAQDNCTGYSVTYAITGSTTASGNDDATGTDFMIGESVVTYTITDANGNTATCQFEVNVTDCTDPTINCPGDMTVVCDGTGNITELNAWLASATATENCQDDPAVSTRLVNTISGCGNSVTLVYEFSASDNYGNDALCEASFIIMDNAAPDMTTQAQNMSVVCDGTGNSEALNAWLNNNGGAEASDNCGAITWTHNFTANITAACSGTGSFTVTFTATDDCGNTSTTTADFTITDAVAPEISCPDNITLSCNDTNNSAIINNWLASASGNDDCSTVTMTNNFASLDMSDCGDTGVTAVQFTATDGCSNTSTCTATITIVDNDNPVITTGPSNLTLECDDATNTTQINTWLANNGGALGSDSCDDSPVWSNVEANSSTQCGNATTTTYIFTLTDACGNASTTSAQVIIEDNTAPALTPPVDETVECDGSGNTAALNTWLASATTAMDCGAMPTISSRLDNTISGCGAAYTEVYLFTATDACGNTTTATATFTIEDTTNPSISCPSNLTLECGGETNNAQINTWLASVTSSDDCSAVTITHDYDSVFAADCGDAGTYTVTFTATDDCNRSSTCQASIIIEDNTAPTINCPVDLTLECNNVNNQTLIVNWLDLANASDECGDVTITNDYNSTSLDCTGASGSVVTFTATDECSNTSTCTATIILIDDQNPQITTFPEDFTLECGDVNESILLTAWLDNNGGAVASDNCDTDLVWTATAQTVIDNCGSTSEAPYLFTVTDDCGNTATAIASFIIVDTTDPVLNVPADQTVECDGAGNTAALSTWLNSATATDDCDDVTITTELENTISGCGSTEAYVYRFIATDACDNVSSATAQFSIVDGEDPVLTCPSAPLILECGNANNTNLINTWLASASATDDCGSVNVTNNYSSIPTDLQCTGGGVVTVTFSATDECGNDTTCDAEIRINDTQAPSITCPDDLTLTCNGDDNASLIQSWLALVTASDDCGDVDVTNDYDNSVALNCAGAIGTTVTFTAADACDNTTTCTATIILIDEEVPVITTLPSDLTIECADPNATTMTNAWLANNGAAIATDNCDNDLTWANAVQTSTAQCGNTTTTPYLFTVTDDCGNTATAIASVVIMDTTPPSINTPASVTVNCEDNPDAVAWANTFSATDLCGGVDNRIVLIEVAESCSSGITNIVHNYSFYSIDDCGNISAQEFASYTIQDITAPTITAPADLNLVCTDDMSAAILAWIDNYTTADNCSPTEALVVTNDYVGVPDVCGGNTTVTWTVTDVCGASSTDSAQIIVADDTTDPVITCATDLTLECGNTNNAALIQSWLTQTTATDDCGDATVANDYSGTFTDACGETGSVIVTFTATDDCGNTSTCQANIIIQDTTDPEFVLAPTDLILECGDINNNDLIDAWIAANGNAIADDDCSDEALTWSADQVTTDLCGNSESRLVTFTVTDNCGNTATATATIFINDTTDPVLTLPADETHECENVTKSLSDWLADASATDECGTVSITNEIWNTISGCGATNATSYLFTATDECGNSSTGIATYTITDTQAPIFDAVPMNLSLECGANNNETLISSWLNAVTASDPNGCDTDITITNDFDGNLPVILECNGGAGVMVTFTAIDDCGNSSTTMGSISMNDTEPPVFVNCPADFTLNVSDDNCDREIIFSTPYATDTCDDLVEVTLTSALGSGDQFPVGTTTVSFLATDECNNTVECSFDVTIVDSDEPSLQCPIADIQVCADTGSCEWIATDQTDPITPEACTGFVVTYQVTNPDLSLTNSGNTTGVATLSDEGVALQLGTSTVMYTVTDVNGNTTTCSFDVVVSDCEAPTITCSDFTISCGSEDLDAWQNTISLTTTDNCSTDGAMTVTRQLITDFSSCGNTFDQLYEFTVVDDAGNTTSCFARYTTTDTEAPVITDAIDETVECDPGTTSAALLAWLQDNGGATFTSDNCSTDVTWTNDFTGALNASCGGTGATSVVFTATDDCGNTSTTEASFIIVDTTIPVNSCPDDITLECGNPLNEEIINGWLAQASSNDNCSVNVTITNNYDADGFTNVCGNARNQTVTFTFTDDCGNVDTCEGTITIEDSTSPTIETEAQDLTLECAADNTAAIALWESNQGGALASDECSPDPLVWTIDNTVVLATCGSTTRTLYTFQVEDNCGNTSTTQASIIIEDTTAPLLTLPAPQTDADAEECGDIVVSLADWQAEAVHSDACGNTSIEIILWNTISGCGNTETEVYLFTVTDDCGNQTTGFSTYEIQDRIAPEITCANDITLECNDPTNADQISAWLATTTASDVNDCNVVNITHDYNGSLPALSCDGSSGKVVTFTATDACGNTTTCQASIFIEDTTDPSFVNFPDDITVNVDVDNCSNNVVYSTPIGFDKCDDEVEVELLTPIASGQEFPIGTSTVTFSVTDDCGNSIQESFDITVIDSDVPSIDCPSNDVIVCTDENTCTWAATAATDPIFNDNCANASVSYSYTAPDGSVVNSMTTAGETFTLLGDDVILELGTTSITYTITDESGNTSTCSFDVVVEDCQAPTIGCFDQIDIPCGDEDLTTWFEDIALTTTDNCSTDAAMVVDILLLTDFSSCGSTFDQVYQFTVTDDAGNTAICTARYNTVDTVVPVIDTEASDLTLACDAEDRDVQINNWLAANGLAAASDACSLPLEWTNDYTGEFDNTCGDIGASLVTFTVADDCGNTSMTQASIIIEDQSPPTITCPLDLTLQCNNPDNDFIITTWLSTAMAEDDCSEVTVSNDYTAIPTCDESVVVTFTVEGNCDGAAVMCTATITVEDDEKPVIMNAPQDLFVECDGSGNTSQINAWLNSNTANDASLGMSAVDLCTDVNITALETMRSDECGGTTTITYEFTAADLCGNTISEIAKVFITDTEAPQLVLPTATNTVACEGDVQGVLQAWLDSATSSNICGSATVTYALVEDLTQCQGTNTLRTLEYIFIAEDDCGFTTRENAVFTIVDEVAPVITAPEDLVLSCGEEIGARVITWLMSYTVVEACQTYEVSNDFDGVVPNLCGGSEVVTWVVTDDCGATSSSTATIIITDDTVPPTIDYCPADITITTEVGQCDAVINYGTPTASDCNGPVTIIKTSGPDVGTMLDAGQTETIEFTITDACGNADICSFDVTVLDQQEPEITCPSNDVIKCTDPNTCTWTSDDDVSPTDFNDNCPNYSITYEITGTTVSAGNDDAAGEIFNLGDSYVKYFIIDANGNELDSCEFMVVVNDCESPTITCSDELAITCGDEDIDTWYATISATAADNCNLNADLIVDTLLINDIYSCGNTFEKTYLFTVSDIAGNTSTCTATYMTVDTEGPTFTNEAEDLTIECDGTNQSILLQGWLNSNANATATDNCGDEITWTNNYTGAVNVICPGTSEIPVIFTATDDCGNTSQTSATFRIEDTTPPIMALPDDLTLDCGDPFNPFFISIWASGASAIDQCQGITFVTNSIVGVTDGCGATSITEYEFRSEDACGNITRDTLTVTTQDLEAPAIGTQPTDLVVECGSTADINAWLNNNGGATATDNCSDEPLVWTFEAGNSVQRCGLTEATEYTFTVTDNCGNTNTVTASVITEDTTDPVLTPPVDQIEECGNESISVTDWIATATATDVCGDVTIDHVLWNSNLGCGSTFYERYLFTATDECGNSSTAFAEYQTLDRTDPIITCPADLVLECGDVNNTINLQAWLDSVTATDPFGCSEVTLSYDVPSALPDLSCDSSEGITVSFFAVDDCGNDATCTAQVFIVDTTNPTFVNCPTDLTVNVDVDLCGANTIFSTPVADDNCEVSVAQTAGLPSGSEFPVGVTMIEYTATDDCGNTALCQFNITVIDSDVPVVLCPSNTIVVETDPSVCTWTSDDRVNPSVSIENCPNQEIIYTITGATIATGTDNVEGEIFNLGLSEVCYTITDPSNNSSSCCFDVEVIDLELPIVTCPADTILISNGEVDGICVADFTWNHPTPTDNCGLAQLDASIMAPDWSTTDLPNVTPGAEETQAFAAGWSYVNYTVTDDNGNTNTCSFKVEVIGIKQEKTIQRVTQNPDDSYCTEFNIRVWNTGNNVGRYTLYDLPAFDDDFIILSAEYSSSVHPSTVLPTNVPTDGWLLGDDVLMPGFGTHNYTLTVCTIVDLKDPDTPGDAMYTKCGERQTPPVGNAPGQALFNESIMDVNGDDIPDIRDSVCADIPYITHEKDFLGYTRNADRTYDAQFKVTVQNIGGAIGQYDLWDEPFFDDDFVINSMSYTTDIDDGAGATLLGSFADAGPYTLADDQVLDYDSTHCYILTFNVSINLSDPATVGDELYVWCGTTSPDGTPQPGEGLYNESYLDRSNDGNPEEIEHACGDIEIVDLALRKTLVTPTPYAYNDILDFEIEIFNQGNIDLYEIEINDYMPIGYDFASVTTNDPNWTQVSAGLLRYDDIDGPLAPASSIVIPLQLRLLQTTGGYKDWNNYAEVHYMEDVNGVDKSLEDVDSTPDADDTNDNPVMVGDDDDDVITEGGPYFNEDEDDHDPAGPYIFDLALSKIHDAAASTYAYEGAQIFNIEVYNQGNEDAVNIEIVDTIPCGLKFDETVALNSVWTYDLASNEISTTITGPLAPGTSIIVPVELDLVSCYDTLAFVNYAEIAQADDTDPLTVGLPDDIDSDADDDNTNDVGGTPNDPNEDNVVSDPGIIDEDDHDPEEIQFFDLALRKTVDFREPYDIGDTVTFRIKVFNQGTITADNIELNDYPNSGYLFDPILEPNWTDSGSELNTALVGTLAPGDSVEVTLQLVITLDSDPTQSDWYNWAEIAGATDTLGNPVIDIDSTPDSDTPDEREVIPDHPDDNNICGHGPDSPYGPEDEDDHDPEMVVVVGGIGDYVWKDLDGDGIQDINEPGVEGVPVILTDCMGNIVYSTVTDADGFYFFNALIPGNYQVQFDISSLPDGCAFTYQDQGTDDTLDSDVDLTGLAPCTFISGGEYDSTFDAGLLFLASLGDFVWHDLDGDGIQDAGEPGLENVTVNLYDGTGAFIATTLTDANGLYLFENLYPGDYYVEFVAPVGMDLTDANQGINDGLDSDVDNSNGPGTTTITTLVAGENDLDWDAGYYFCVPIGEQVWYDINENDLWDSEENGINGLVVNLWRQDGNGSFSLYATELSAHKPGTPSDDGYYKFCAPPGTYYIEVILPPQGLVPAVANVGTDEAVDSDITNANGIGTTDQFSVSSGDVKCDLGHGYYPMAQLGDRAWNDVNEDGLQDSNEPPLSGVKVKAFNMLGVQVGETKTTDSNGHYMMDYLGKDSYFLEFTPPPGYILTQANAGDDLMDSDADGSYGVRTTAAYTLVPGDSIPSIDVGFVYNPVLPIEWKSIIANNRGEYNQIDWTTLSELNADRFILERRFEEDESFNSIGELAAKGNPNSGADYQYLDYNLEKFGLYYYRVLQQDKDGQFSYSDVVSADYQKTFDTQVEVYPNPTVEKFNVDLSLSKTAQVSIDIFDATGKFIKTLMNDESKESGQHVLEVDISDLLNGVYNIKITIDDSVIDKRLIVLKN